MKMIKEPTGNYPKYKSRCSCGAEYEAEEWEIDRMSNICMNCGRFVTDWTPKPELLLESKNE